jgi:hypothetical protein
MVWQIPAAIVASSLIGGSSARSAASSSADAQVRAAEIAAREQRFRPYGLTTRFGRSMFDYEIPGEAPPTEPVQGADETDEAFAARMAEFPNQVADYARRARTEGVATGYGYETSPEIRAYQDRLANLTGLSLGQAEDALTQAMPLVRGRQRLTGLAESILPTQVSREADPFGLAYAQRLEQLGEGILPTRYDPNAAAQSYFQEQQALLDPQRQREEQRLASGLFGRGRAGLSISGQGQPELYTLAQSRGQQDLALAAQARERARQELQQDIGLGTGFLGQGLQARTAATELGRRRFGEDIAQAAGLFGTGGDLQNLQYQLQVAGMSPFLTQFGATQQLEEAGLLPLRLSAELGGRSSQAGAAAGQSLLQGGSAAAQTRLQGSLVGPTMLAGATNSLLSNPYFMQGMFNQPTTGATSAYMGGLNVPGVTPYTPNNMYSLPTTGVRFGG